jgi:heat-inducible transcriptional repressor
MRQLEDQVNRQIYSDGIIEMLSQPEFLPALLKEDDVDRAVERLRQVLHTLTGNDSLRTLIVHALDQEGVHVVIGEEHGNDELRDYSVILSRYGVNGEVHGVLGIIGPTRMAYPRSISTVSYISTVMSDLLRDIYGIETRPDRAQS